MSRRDVASLLMLRTSRGFVVAPLPGLALVLLALALAFPGCRPRTPFGGPPNLVVVIADDQGWRDYGFMGSPVARTPNLDSLAASGTVFTHAFTTASACRPSLRTLLTGVEPERLDALRRSMPQRRVRFPELAAMRAVDTLPRALGEQGYVSFQGGKHWEGRFDLTGFTAGTAEGFDPDRASKGGALRDFWGGAGLALGRTTMEPLFDFLAAHADDRFLIWFAPLLPHVPHDPAAEYVARYADAGLSPAEAGYFGNVSRLDDRVGELLVRLDALGLRERTLVLFLADNGWEQTAGPGSATESIGGPHGKFSIDEDGFRTPMIVSWPGKLPAGRREDALVSALDVVPTLLDFAGAPPLPGRDGVSLRAWIEGRTGPPDRGFLVGSMGLLRTPPDERSPPGGVPVHDETAYWVRMPGWRYVSMPERSVEALYAIDEDPLEQHDVSVAHPDRVATARAALAAWKRKMRVPPPTRLDTPEPAQPPSSM